MKQFFNITQKYRFEWGDFFAVGLLINLILIMTIGFYASYFGLDIALFGLFLDYKNPNRHINDFLMRITTITMNLYFLYLLYQ